MGAANQLAFDRSLRRFDHYGRMHVEVCNITKANVCAYYGHEVPNYKALGLDAGRLYKFYRDPVELEKAAPSFDNLPLLEIHVKVDADKPAQDSVVGTTGTGTKFSHPYLQTPITVWTSDAIAKVEAHQQEELSSAYGWRPDMTPGTSPDGELYDGVMRDIIGNHVALVKNGRAGSDVIVADSQPLELKPMKRSKFVEAIKAFLKDGADLNAVDVAMDGALLAYDQDTYGLSEDEMKVAKDAAIKAKGSDLTDEEEKAVYKTACDAKKTVPHMQPAMDENMISKADAEKLAQDAATKAATETVTKINALHDARRKVEPLVGVVACDSADEVYKFALEKHGVDVKGVDASAFPALVDLALKSRAPSRDAGIAADSEPTGAFSVRDLFPALSNVRANA